MVGEDNWGALVVGPEVMIDGRPRGPLSGLDFVVKDVFDVAGYRTSAGNPDFAAQHPPATVTAPAVQALVEAGARLVGKAITDEFTWSLAGVNQHYGTPRNPRAPDRMPGGSSSGSAVAVASGMVPFALGTDTAGSIRVPASYCGIFGIRPTHGRVDTTGVLPLAPSYDTVGWLAADGATLREVGRQLLPKSNAPVAPPRVNELIVLSDAFMLADDDVRPALVAAVDRLAAEWGLPVSRHHFSEDGVRGWQRMADAYPKLMAREAWASYGEWITTAQPRMADDIRARFASAAAASAADADALAPLRKVAGARHAELCRNGAVLIVPAAASLAPRLDMPAGELPAIRARTLAVGIVATLAGAPSLSLPVTQVHDLPINIAVIGRRGADEALLDLAAVLDES